MLNKIEAVDHATREEAVKKGGTLLVPHTLLQAGFAEDGIIKYGICFHKKSCLIKVKM